MITFTSCHTLRTIVLFKERSRDSDKAKRAKRNKRERKRERERERGRRKEKMAGPRRNGRTRVGLER